MRPLAAAALGALVAAATLIAAGAFASGPPPVADPSAPGVKSIVTHGSANLHVDTPDHRTNTTIERAMREARFRAFPKAVEAARREAKALAAATGLTLAGPLGAARDTSPYGYWDPDAGRFGPGRWCGRLVTRSRDGTRRSHHGCPIPRGQIVKVTVTFAVR